MSSKEAYGATPAANASATGAADSTTALLGAESSDASARGSGSRFWKDIGICVGALALIVGAFFGTVELMNYEYPRTTFEVYTGCMSPATTTRLARAGFEGPAHAAYVVPRNGAPVKMAPAGPNRPGVFVVTTWMPFVSEWAFAVAPAHAPETPAVLFSESGNATLSPLALPRAERCAVKSDSGAFARELSEEAVAEGAFVSHVFGSCDWSCNSRFPPGETDAASPAGPVDEMSGDDVTFIESGAPSASARASTGPGVERFSAPPVYPGAPDTNAVLEAPVGEDGIMVLPDGIPSGVVLMEGGDERAFTAHRQDDGPIDVDA